MPILTEIQGYARFAWQLLDGSRLAYEQTIATARQQDITPFIRNHQPLRVLDLANGRLRPQFTLINAASDLVYGIDLANRPESNLKDISYSWARWMYGRRLKKRSPDLGGLLICGDASTLPFADNSFDLVTSIAAFEHFLDVPRVMREIYRVLRPGGLVWAGIHLFSSPSGGHNLGYSEIPLRSMPPGVDPWDHLRGRKLPISVPLNQWRRDQYVEEFARHFHIVKQYCSTREGEELLTPQIQAELPDYTREELTCLGYIIVASRSA